MQGERGEAARAFLGRSGWHGATVSALPGDASTRRYYRVLHRDRSAMLMDQPQAVETPPCPPSATAQERWALGYNAVARLAGADCGRFIATAKFLRGRGIAAPEIYADEAAQGFVLLEDLGDDLYADVLANGADEPTLYGAAVDTIAVMQREPAPAELWPGARLHSFDLAARLAEVDLLTEWFVPLALGRQASADEVEEHHSLWSDAFDEIRSEPVFVHRDYHAQNLFWLPSRSGTARVGIIDFQDAVAGNRSYDLVSLVEDARRDVAPELADAMKDRYLAAMSANGCALEEESWSAEVAVTAAQRNAKIAGIFARLARRDHKPRYLAHLPRVWNHLERDLAHPALTPLRTWYDRTIPRETRREVPCEGIAA